MPTKRHDPETTRPSTDLSTRTLRHACRSGERAPTGWGQRSPPGSGRNVRGIANRPTVPVVRGTDARGRVVPPLLFRRLLPPLLFDLDDSPCGRPAAETVNGTAQRRAQKRQRQGLQPRLLHASVEHARHDSATDDRDLARRLGREKWGYAVPPARDKTCRREAAPRLQLAARAGHPMKGAAEPALHGRSPRATSTR